MLDTGHELRGPLGIFTNGWVETGLATCRVLLDFLETSLPKRKGDVVITMFRDRCGSNLDMVPRESTAKLHPSDITDSMTLQALNFAHQAASKRVAHLTFGGPESEEENELCQIASLAIREAVGRYLYERLGMIAPSSIITDFKISNVLR